MRVLLIKGTNIRGNLYTLAKREKQYLMKVLRLEVGTTLKCKDEKEKFYDATIMDEDTLSLTESTTEENFLDSMPSYSGPFAEITLIQAVCKGKKNEKIARECQEAGVRRIIFSDSTFSDEHVLKGHDLERVETITREAVQQSGGKLLHIETTESLEDAMKKAEGVKIILHQGVREKSRNIYDVLESRPEGEMKVTLMVGPEGGFADEECELAETLGFVPVLLNTNILRAETAGIYAVAAVETLLNR